MLIARACPKAQDIEGFFNTYGEYAEEFAVVGTAPKVIVLYIKEEYEDRVREIFRTNSTNRENK